MTIDELLASYEIFAMSEVEKGERFERLMKNFLLTYPIWRGKISDAWLWKDFPFRDELGGRDLGIDLVAKTVDGEFWAAQCKFYAESTTINKSAVDSFISNSARTFNGGRKFARRLWISTSDNFTSNAREMCKNQTPAVEFIDLSALRRAQVNWSRLDNGFSHEEAVIVRKLRDYQVEAVEKAREHFETNERGKLIMACGTGKTFTALKIAEAIVGEGKILFLVPSISLLSQTLEEWTTFVKKPLNAICICSDATAVGNFDDDIVDINLPIPAMTDSDKISVALKDLSDDRLTVIFSTYQSIDVVIRLNLTFDLIICDEAHRTATSGNEETVFTKVHSENNIHGKRRMYMTATPKLFKTGVKDSVVDVNKLTDWSMDNEEIFGKEFFSISFAEAAARGYLSEYKVLVFTLDETFLSKQLKDSINEQSDSLKVDDALKIVGCINALSKKMDSRSREFIMDDPNQFMHTVVAFYKSIADAEHFARDFSTVQEKYFADMTADERKTFVNITADFVFGSRKVGRKTESMTSTERSNKLHALKTTPLDGNDCRILNNVRCLAEGVDVPALDAIIFMASKKSQVEIVQAVGRVMRKAPHKKFGYIIIPVIVPMSKSPEEALNNSEDFKDVWKIINALRAHDENMNIEIERIRNYLSSDERKSGSLPGSGKIIIENVNPQLVLGDLFRWNDLRNKIYARMVEHVGNRLYWIQWAQKVTEIVERHTKRINELISVEGKPREDFYKFVDALHKNLNPSVTPDEAVDMLAQHLVTRPVFEALFENYSFVKNNPVSVAMQEILDKLDKDGMSKDREIFARLYDRVREMCFNMGDAAQRQSIIIRLYDSFFRIALKKTAEKLGIVYTPVEVVDFILRSVDAVLKKNFDRSLSDKNVHVLDPFTGTGTFITRLIQSGLIRKKDLLRKYQSELHANEIVLLAYYIAAINIENAFHDRVDAKNYQPFEGICFTDTFQAYEQDENAKGQTDFVDFRDPMKENSERVKNQTKTRIEVIVGNPPYSVGQRSANDNNQNQFYKNLESRIAATYAAKTNATNKNSLYDSYIKAFRWAGDRITEGVIGFVTNAGWIDGAAMDGLRKCFAEEFAEIYVFNLRGNQRTQGETSRREGGKIFGSGSRAPIAVTILVKAPHEGSAKIFYRDIGDYLSRDDKLSIIQQTPNVLHESFQLITPNDRGDWINQRGDDFDTFIPLAPAKKFDGAAKSFFVTYSSGLKTGRDYVCYNFSETALRENIKPYINTTNELLFVLDGFQVISPTRIQRVERAKKSMNAGSYVESVYRPFCKEFLHYNEDLNQRRYQMPKFFPTGREENLLICIVYGERNFSVLMTNKITDVQFQFNGQCFPLYYYEQSKEIDLFRDNYERRDGVSDWIMNRARKSFGDVSKEDIFYYVYGFLHLPSYREKFSAELKKSLPRIILTPPAKKFWELSRAGRNLADIHLNYETQPPADVEVEIRAENYRIKKLRLVDDKRTLIYNDHITIKNIPPRSFEYKVNGRSPLEWIIDRYQVKTDSASGIVNDPNDWAIEHDNPRYILDLILSSITVSLKTLDIVENLPMLTF